jgi:curved DNA-binding protein CbpA
MNLYDELELQPTCTPEEIKQKYRLLAQIYHPDKAVFGDEEKFKRVKLAYEVLSDPVRRAEYDSTGKYNIDLSIRNEAISRLNNMIANWTQHMNPEFDDLILKMKVDIHETGNGVRNQISTNEANIKRLILIAERIKLKQEGENILKSFVESRIQQIKNEIDSLNRTLLIFKLMLEILENYHYNLTDLNLLLPDE